MMIIYKLKNNLKNVEKSIDPVRQPPEGRQLRPAVRPVRQGGGGGRPPGGEAPGAGEEDRPLPGLLRLPEHRRVCPEG